MNAQVDGSGTFTRSAYSTNQTVAITGPRRKRIAAPTLPKPISNRAQLAGSGTADVTADVAIVKSVRSITEIDGLDKSANDIEEIGTEEVKPIKDVLSVDEGRWVPNVLPSLSVIANKSPGSK
jgi:hypothetical protein